MHGILNLFGLSMTGLLISLYSEYFSPFLCMFLDSSQYSMEIIISIDLALWSGPVDFLEEIFFHQQCDREVDITQLTLTTALTFSDNSSLKCGLGMEQGSARP